MFKKDANYWITIRSNGTMGQMNIKGKVIEENAFMIKVLREATDKYPEKETLIMLSEIVRINEATEKQGQLG